jgi:hypothetical protein
MESMEDRRTSSLSFDALNGGLEVEGVHHVAGEFGSSPFPVAFPRALCELGVDVAAPDAA